MATAGSVASAAPVIEDARLRQVRAQLTRTMQRLKRHDLAPQPVLDKLREGLAKAVPAARIAQVAVRLADFLVESKRTVPRASPALRQAYATARLSGASTAVIRHLLGALRPRERTRWAVRLIDAIAELSATSAGDPRTLRLAEKLADQRRFTALSALPTTLSILQSRYGLSAAQASSTLMRAVIHERQSPRAALKSLAKTLRRTGGKRGTKPK